MLGKTLLLCSSILLLVVPAWGQSDTKASDQQGQQVSPAPTAGNLNSIQSELSSVVTPPTSPAALMGVAKGFAAMGQCCNSSGKPVLCGSSVDIVWYNSPTGAVLSNFNSLTFIISSLPPGPASWTLPGGFITTPLPVDSTVVVLDKTTCLECFTGTSLPGSVALQQVESWFQTAYKCPWNIEDSGAYPAMQWSPYSVTLIYQ